MMNKAKWQHFMSALLLTSILVLVLVSVTHASHYASSSFAGDTATALKVNTVLSPGITWRAEIYSDMYNNTVINGIGWSWWKTFHKCNGVVFTTTTLAAVSAQDVAHQARVYDQGFYGCSTGVRRIGHEGNHEYKKTGLTTLYLYTVTESSFAN